jgi:hypothetical protein
MKRANVMIINMRHQYPVVWSVHKEDGTVTSHIFFKMADYVNNDTWNIGTNIPWNKHDGGRHDYERSRSRPMVIIWFEVTWSDVTVSSSLVSAFTSFEYEIVWSNQNASHLWPYKWVFGDITCICWVWWRFDIYMKNMKTMITTGNRGTYIPVLY